MKADEHTAPYRVVSVGRHTTRLSQAERYFGRVETVETFSDIAWQDILLRRVRLIAVPNKRECRNASERAKRFFCKLLLLTLSGEIAARSLDECFLPADSEKIIITYAGTEAIYRWHFESEGFHVLECKNETKKARIHAFAKRARAYMRDKGADESEGLTVFLNPYDTELLHLYRKIHPKRRIVLRLHDSIEGGLGKHSMTLQRLSGLIARLIREGTVNEAESYSAHDAAALGISYRPNGVNVKKVRSLDLPWRKELGVFMGGASGRDVNQRTQTLLPVIEAIKRAFGFYAPIEVRIAVKDAQWEPYPAYLKEAAEAEVFIDMVKLSQSEGFSFRIPEALALNRKIITNRMAVLSEPFYSPERVFVIGRDSEETLRAFLERDIDPVPKDVLDLYDTSLWWTPRDPRSGKKVSGDLS
jgi:hypothetical protein